MRHDRNLKVVRMIPLQEIASTTVSAATQGSGGKVSQGIADLTGYDFCRVEIRRRTLASANTKIEKFHLYFASGATTLAASGTLFSGRTSGIVLSAKTASRDFHAIEINLHSISNLKRYMGCKIEMSGTSAAVDVTAYLIKGKIIPTPSPVSQTTFNYTSITSFGF